MASTTMFSVDTAFINFMNIALLFAVTSCVSFYFGRRYERLIQRKSLVRRFFDMFHFNFNIDERVGTEAANFIAAYTQFLNGIDTSSFNNYIREATRNMGALLYMIGTRPRTDDTTRASDTTCDTPSTDFSSTYRPRVQSRVRAPTKHVAMDTPPTTGGSDDVDLYTCEGSDSEKESPAKRSRTATIPTSGHYGSTNEQLRQIFGARLSTDDAVKTAVDTTDKMTDEVTSEEPEDASEKTSDAEKVTVSDGGPTDDGSDGSDGSDTGGDDEHSDSNKKSTVRRRIRIVKK